jgi:uncharacterized protein
MNEIAPIDSNERIGELDVLRGFALLGVFVVHFVGAAFYELPLSEAQQEVFMQGTSNQVAMFISELFFYSKANTLFAMLFGMGFWVMMERLKARGTDFERIYKRRLLALLLLGAINIIFIFPGDILHEYALVGFALFFMRNLSARTMIILGVSLALIAEPLVNMAMDAVGSSNEAWYATQKAAFEHGGYWNWVELTSFAHFQRDILLGGALGWLLYILGRFLVGAWIVRKRWIQRVPELLPTIRRLFLWTMMFGLIGQLISVLIYMETIPGPVWAEELLHYTSAPTLALAYALGLILMFRSKRWSGLAMLFAPVGRMALTAYVAHGAVFTFVFFPFGLDLLGSIGPAHALIIALGLYAVMTWLCHIWLRYCRFGPLEYLWRWATYGARP